MRFIALAAAIFWASAVFAQDVAPPPATQPSEEQIDAAGDDARHELQVAKDKSTNYLYLAKCKCLAKLQASPEWAAAKRRCDTLDSIAANSMGDPDIQAQAKASAAAADAELARIQNAVMDQDDDVRDARQLVAIFSPGAAKPVAPAPPPPVMPAAAPAQNDHIATLIAAGKIESAISEMEQIRTRQPTDEENLLRLAAYLIRDNNPTRAAKLLTEYEDRTPGRENVQDALGTALSRIQKWNDTYWSFKNFYTGYDEQLSARRKNGMARWGTQWIPAQQAASNWHTAIAAQQNLLAAAKAVDKAQAALDTLVQERADAESKTQTAFTRNAEIEHFNYVIEGITNPNNARRQVAKAQQNLLAAQETYNSSQPQFPATIDGIVVP
jgi:hypothetical protein